MKSLSEHKKMHLRIFIYYWKGSKLIDKLNVCHHTSPTFICAPISKSFLIGKRIPEPPKVDILGKGKKSQVATVNLPFMHLVGFLLKMQKRAGQDQSCYE